MPVAHVFSVQLVTLPILLVLVRCVQLGHTETMLELTICVECVIADSLPLAAWVQLRVLNVVQDTLYSQPLHQYARCAQLEQKKSVTSVNRVP